MSTSTRSRARGPAALTHQIVTASLYGLEPNAVRLWDVIDPQSNGGGPAAEWWDALIAACFAELSTPSTLTRDEQAALETELKTTLPATAQRAFIRYADSFEALHAAHASAGFLLGVTVGRRIAGGG